MSEEAIADSVETETSEPEFDMDGAVNQMGEDLFGKSETEESETHEIDSEETDETSETEDDKEEKPEKDEDQDDSNELDVRERPVSWKKDMEETWKSMSKEAQDYVLQREEQMKEGLSINKQDADIGLSIRDALEPYSQQLEQHGVDSSQMVKNLLSGHLQMMTADPDTRKNMLLSLAQNYGVDLNPAEPQEGIDPTVQNLQNEVKELRGILTVQQQRDYQRQQQEFKQNSDRVNQEVNEFAENHPHFDELADEIADQVRAGKDLEKAYQIAFRNSDYYAEQLRQETAEELEKKRKEKAEQAQQATSVNVRSRDTGKAPTAPLGSMDDTMRETMRAIKNRTSH